MDKPSSTDKEVKGKGGFTPLNVTDYHMLLLKKNHFHLSNMTKKSPNNILPSSKRLREDASAATKGFHNELCFSGSVSQGLPVFHANQATLRTPATRNSHWSIAWSDLMMTMFILFLSLFVYQAAHRDFLMDKKTEIIAGETVEAIEIKEKGNATFPFVVIHPSAPIMKSETVKKVETIALQDIDLDSVFSSSEINSPPATEEFAPADQITLTPPEKTTPAPSEMYTPTVSEDVIISTFTDPVQVTNVIQPLPIGFVNKDSVDSLFTKSRQTLDTLNLNDFATIDLVPDKAVKIVLTSDLLFETGHASLSLQAVQSLEKIASIIEKKGYQIRIEGHTDDVPIFAGQYANNWELSIARANAVAVFLIHDMKMDPEKIVVSGYASYRPVVPNTSESNRARNRRVEIVISQPSDQERTSPLTPPISANTNL